MVIFIKYTALTKFTVEIHKHVYIRARIYIYMCYCKFSLINVMCKILI